MTKFNFYSSGRSGGKTKAVKDMIDAGLEIMVVVPDEEKRDRIRKYGIPDRLIIVGRDMVDNSYELVMKSVDEFTTEMEKGGE